MKQKPSILTIIIALIIGIYFIYKGIQRVEFYPDIIGILGIGELACGVILLGLSAYWFLKKPKSDEE